MKNKIYLPVENVNDYACYEVVNYYTIRAYVDKPMNNSSSKWVDYHILDNHYLEDDGNNSSSWGTTSRLPVCLSTDQITNNYWYSNAFPSALFIFCFLCFFIYVILHILFKPLGRWLHV